MNNYYLTRLEAAGTTILDQKENVPDGIGYVLAKAAYADHTRIITYDLDEAQNEGDDCVYAIQSWMTEAPARAEFALI